MIKGSVTAIKNTSNNTYFLMQLEYNFIQREISTSHYGWIIDLENGYIDGYPTGRDWHYAGTKMESWWPHDIIKLFMSINVLLIAALFVAYWQTEILAENYLQPENFKESNMPEKIVKTD